MLHIAVMFTVRKLARFRGSRVNERWVGASFSPFRNLSGPMKTGFLLISYPDLSLTKARSGHKIRSPLTKPKELKGFSIHILLLLNNLYLQ